MWWDFYYDTNGEKYCCMEWNCTIFFQEAFLLGAWRLLYSRNKSHGRNTSRENKRANTFEKLFQDYLTSCNFQIYIEMEMLNVLLSHKQVYSKFRNEIMMFLMHDFNNSIVEYFFEQTYTCLSLSYINKWRNMSLH